MNSKPIVNGYLSNLRGGLSGWSLIAAVSMADGTVPEGSSTLTLLQQVLKVGKKVLWVRVASFWGQRFKILKGNDSSCQKSTGWVGGGEAAACSDDVSVTSPIISAGCTATSHFSLTRWAAEFGCNCLQVRFSVRKAWHRFPPAALSFNCLCQPNYMFSTGKLRKQSPLQLPHSVEGAVPGVSVQIKNLQSRDWRRPRNMARGCVRGVYRVTRVWLDWCWGLWHLMALFVAP